MMEGKKLAREFLRSRIQAKYIDNLHLNIFQDEAMEFSFHPVIYPFNYPFTQ